MYVYGRIILITLILTLFATGCFDLEAEIKMLDDGSGFVTVWARMPTRMAMIASILMGSDLERESTRVLTGLDDVFAEQPGLRLAERTIFSSGTDHILRYRYSFDNVQLLDQFWAAEENQRQDITLHDLKAVFNKIGNDCNAKYHLEVAFAPIPPNRIYELGTRIFADQPERIRRQLFEEYYKGAFRLRLVLPGQNAGSDAPLVDVAGYPVWQTTMIDLYRLGLSAKTDSEVQCHGGTARFSGADEKIPVPAEPITAGPLATMPDVSQSLNNLGYLISLDMNIVAGKKSTMQITYRIDQRIDQPTRSFLLLPFATMPSLAQDWESAVSRDPAGNTLFRIQTKHPLRLDETGSSFLYAGKDQGRFIFRMNLPQLIFLTHPAPEAVGPVVIKIHLQMPATIKGGNATMLNGDKAEWILTMRDLRAPLILEAFCD